jgi:hypothetical protein
VYLFWLDLMTDLSLMLQFAKCWLLSLNVAFWMKRVLGFNAMLPSECPFLAFKAQLFALK